MGNSNSDNIQKIMEKDKAIVYQQDRKNFSIKAVLKDYADSDEARLDLYRLLAAADTRYSCIDEKLLCRLISMEGAVVRTAIWLILQTDIGYKEQDGIAPMEFPINRKRCAEVSHMSTTSVTHAIQVLTKEKIIKISVDNKKFSWLPPHTDFSMLNSEDDEGKVHAVRVLYRD